MAKRKPEEAPKGAPAWQSTFADLMNLLLCFFVLLFSMSSIDAEKFQEIASSFSNTFSIFSSGGSSFDDGLLISNGISQLNNLDKYINNTGAAADSSSTTNKLDKEDANADDVKEAYEKEQLEASEQLAEKVSEALVENNVDKDIDIDFTSQYVQLTLKGSILFDSGSATLREDALPLISKVAMILERYSESTIEIEGHTDNVQLHTAKYENNDVLSMFRALHVANYIKAADPELNPAYVKYSGRGEYEPIADNSTAEGRARNRRVEIRIYNSFNSNLK